MYVCFPPDEENPTAYCAKYEYEDENLKNIEFPIGHTAGFIDGIVSLRFGSSMIIINRKTRFGREYRREYDIYIKNGKTIVEIYELKEETSSFLDRKLLKIEEFEKLNKKEKEEITKSIYAGYYSLIRSIRLLEEHRSRSATILYRL